MELNGYKTTAETLLKLGSCFELSNVAVDSDCLTINEICEFANSTQQLLFHKRHLRQCVRCQSWFELFHGMCAIEAMPKKWSLSVGLEQQIIEYKFGQTLGYVDLDSLKFSACDESLLWRASPSCIRFNLVVDSDIQSVSLSLLEVPKTIKRVFITAFGQPIELEASQPNGTFEFCFLEENSFSQFAEESHSSFFRRVFGDKVELAFESCEIEQKTVSSLSLRGLLDQVGGFEDDCEYVLPSGKVCEVHFNLAKICKHDAILLHLANELEKLLPVDIDVIVSNSWAMAMVARRVARLRNLSTGSASMREVLCEGYSEPVLTDAICVGERVAVVTDVAVTGKQIQSIIGKVVEKGGTIASTTSLVVAEGVEFDFDLTRLLTVDLHIRASDHPRSGKVRLHFNPLANAMTLKKDSRAPSQFLEENEEAAKVWKFLSGVVNETKRSGVQYYKRHHVESGTHYTQFIDTGRLLQHPKFGSYLIEKLRDQLAADSIVPDVVIFPNRSRAELFAKLLVSSFEMSCIESLELLTVDKGRDGFWHFPQGSSKLLEGKSVIIADTAVGSGKTVDLFGIAATEFGAKSVGVCTILSRLPESGELAFEKRFDGGFYRIFNLPTRPVVVRGASSNECPFCYRKEKLKNAAELSGSAAIQQLASLRRRMVVSADRESTQVPPRQLTMFDESGISNLLESCTPTIAGGITLHSLYAAQNNGMATLILPEIRNNKIPSRNREAMVQDLPIGALKWSKGDLDNDLLNSMEKN